MIKAKTQRILVQLIPRRVAWTRVTMLGWRFPFLSPSSPTSSFSWRPCSWLSTGYTSQLFTLLYINVYVLVVFMVMVPQTLYWNRHRATGIIVLIIPLEYLHFLRPFVMVLFKSYNIEQLYKLLVVNDPFTENLDRKKEVGRHFVRR